MDVFHVLTEFRFDVANALVSSNQLQEAVEGVGQAAEETIAHMERLSVSLFSHLGLANIGIMGLVQESIAAAEKFGATQRKLANIFLSNPNNIRGGAIGFQEAMQASSDIMDQILSKSRDFGLPASSMAAMTTQLAAPLFIKGLAGANMENAIELARGILKTAPVLGTDPTQAGSEVVSLLGGRGNIQDQFINRLINDTPQFQELALGHAGGHGGGALSAFNALPDAKRLEIVRGALLHFAQSTEVVEANAKSLTNQFQVLKDTLVGTFSIFKPIGEALTQFISPLLIRFNSMLQEQGSLISYRMGEIIRKLTGNIDSLGASLWQVKQMPHDFAFVKHVFEVYTSIMLLTSVLRFLGVSIIPTAGVLSLLGSGLGTLYTFGSRLLIFLIPFLTHIAVTLAPVIAAMLALFVVMQLFSRAKGIAHVEDIKAMPETMNFALKQLNLAITVFKRVFDPLMESFDSAAKQFAPWFQWTNWLNTLASILGSIAWYVGLVEAAFLGLMDAIKEFMYFIDAHGFASMQGAIGAASAGFTRTYDRTVDENKKALTDPYKAQMAVSQINQYIGNVSIQNAFKEQMEPDRIAFTMIDQLKRVAHNPTSIIGRSLGAPLTR